MDSTDKPREVAIHQSANRPNLLVGGDRELALVTRAETRPMMIAASLAFSLATLWESVWPSCFGSPRWRPCREWARPILSFVMFICATSDIFRFIRRRADCMRQVQKHHGTGASNSMQITQHRTRARGLADLILPFGLVEDGIFFSRMARCMVFPGPRYALGNPR